MSMRQLDSSIPKVNVIAASSPILEQLNAPLVISGVTRVQHFVRSKNFRTPWKIYIV